MPYLRPEQPAPTLIGIAHVALLAAALIGTAGSPSPAAPPVRVRVTNGTWPPAQVRVLIAEIGQSARYGLDPGAYGIAALRAELELCEQLWETPGSRQLDALAGAAALALANDYQRHGARSARVTRAEMNAALGAGRVGPWLAGLAPRGRAS